MHVLKLIWNLLCDNEFYTNHSKNTLAKNKPGTAKELISNYQLKKKVLSPQGGIDERKCLLL